MTQLWLVGGAPRCGKSKLTGRIVARQSCDTLSTDYLRDPLRQFLSELECSALYENESSEGTLAERVDRQNRESAVVWKAVREYATQHAEWSDRPLLIDGVAVLPEYARQLSERIDVCAVFLGNQAPEHVDVLLDHAASNKRDWLHGWSRDRVEHFAAFKVAMSKWLEASATEHGYPYIEMSHDFAAAQARAEALLVSPATVRRLSAAEWQSFRAARLAALRDAPQAFGPKFGDEAVHTQKQWRSMLTEGNWFGVFRHDRLCGIASVAPSWDGSSSERDLGGMWIEPACRGAGLAQLLVDAIEVWAKADGATAVALWLKETNIDARRLYLRAGFQPRDQRAPSYGDTSCMAEKFVRFIAQ